MFEPTYKHSGIVAASNKWCHRSSHLLWWNFDFSAGISHHSGWAVVIVVRMEVCKIRALKSVATSVKASITIVLMSSIDQICRILFAHLVTWVIAHLCLETAWKHSSVTSLKREWEYKSALSLSTLSNTWSCLTPSHMKTYCTPYCFYLATTQYLFKAPGN